MKVALLYEYSDGLWKIKKVKSEQGKLFIEKHLKMDMVSRKIPLKYKKEYQEVEIKEVRPLMLRVGTIWNKIFGLPFYRFIPLYKGSYKQSSVIPFNVHVVEGNLDMAKYKLMSEEDAITELMALNKDIRVFVYFGLGAIIGGLMVYAGMTGGFEGLVAWIGI